MSRLDHPEVIRDQRRARQRELIGELIAAGIVIVGIMAMASMTRECAGSDRTSINAAEKP